MSDEERGDPPETGSAGDSPASEPSGAGGSIRPRPSQAPPSVPPRAVRHAGRLVFAFAWVGLQLTLILTADRRPDGAFGFRMFSESSTIKLALYREIAGEGGARERVHVDDGTWSALDVGGTPRRFSWYERARAPFWTFDREVSASYGAAAQLARLQAALDDVSAHVQDDNETTRLLLDVTVRRNGREPVVHHLASPERALHRGGL